MLLQTMQFLRGHCRVEVRGAFPERFLNVAANRNIYLWNVKKVDRTCLHVSISCAGYALMEEELPQGLTATRLSTHGLPQLWRRYRRRVAFMIGPVAAAVILLVATSFVWTVDVVGGDADLQSRVLPVVQALGVRRGAWKHAIDQKRVKREAILAIDDLAWLWVDLRGTTATVRIEPRTLPPEMVDPSAPCHIIAAETGVIESISTREGVQMVEVGQTVEKGALLISGVLESEEAGIRYRHALGEVRARVWHEKKVEIPKFREVRTETGEEKSVVSLQFARFTINFSQNSSIPYTTYDRITKTTKIPLLPISWKREIFREVHATYPATDTAVLIAQEIQTMEADLESRGIAVVETTVQHLASSDEALAVLLTAETLMRIDEESPIARAEETGGL